MRHLPKHTIPSREALASSATQFGQLLNGRLVDLFYSMPSEFVVLNFGSVALPYKAGRCQSTGQRTLRVNVLHFKLHLSSNAQVAGWPCGSDVLLYQIRTVWHRRVWESESIPTGLFFDRMNSPHVRNRVWMVSKVASGHWAPLLFVCIGISLHCSGKHIT